MRQLSGEADPGHVYVDGTLIGEKQVNGRFVHLSDRELARERAEIGFVFQRFNPFPHLSALDNVTVAPRRVLGMPRAEAEQRALAMLEKVGLAHKANESPSACRAASSGWRSPACSPCSPS